MKASPSDSSPSSIPYSSVLEDSVEQHCQKSHFQRGFFPLWGKCCLVFFIYFAVLVPRNGPLRATWFKVAYEYAGDTNPPSHSFCHLKDGTEWERTAIVKQGRILQHFLPLLKPFPQDTQPLETTLLLLKNSHAIEGKAQPCRLSQLMKICITVVYKGSGWD